MRLSRIAERARAWPLWARLGGSVLLLLLAFWARFALAGPEPGYPFLTFFMAVLLAAVLFGRWPGLFATATSTALGVWFFVSPLGQMQIDDPRDGIAALAFAVTGLSFVWLTSAARRAIRERDAANAALHDGQDRLRTVLDGIGEPFYALDAQWRILYASRAALDIWGRRAEDVIGRHVLDALPKAAGSTPFAAMQEAMRTRRPARLEAVSGVIGRWVAVDIHPSPDGGLSVAFRDIQGRKLAEERQHLLVGELTHRIKNTLALVLAISEQTRRTVSSPDAFHAVFRDRLAALARAHGALQRDGGTETTLEAVAREALSPYLAIGVPRLEIVGPQVRLASGTAVALGIAFHELATNASKHGSLSAPGGRVHLSWHPVQDPGGDGRARHEVIWEETGGPPITGPPAMRGFGTKLLEGGLAAQIGGTVSLDFASAGLRCRMTVPEFADEPGGLQAAPGGAGYDRGSAASATTRPK